jgi:protein SCO1/2
MTPDRPTLRTLPTVALAAAGAVAVGLSLGTASVEAQQAAPPAASSPASTTSDAADHDAARTASPPPTAATAESPDPTPAVRLDPAGRPIPEPPPAVAEPVPGALDGVGLDERLGDPLPLDLTFTDADGASVRLGDFFNDGKPVLINPIYYKCPMLCGLISQGLTDAVRQVQYTPGRDFTIVTVSFAPDETPALARANADATFARLARPEAHAGWHHLVGGSAEIDALLEATGFGVRFQPQTGEWAHPAAIMFAAPDGTITRYLTPTEANTRFNPNTFRRAIEEASEGTVGSFITGIVLSCLQYNHATGEYELAMGVMRAGAGVTVLAIAGGIGGMLYYERRRRLAKAVRPDRTSTFTGPSSTA